MQGSQAPACGDGVDPLPQEGSANNPLLRMRRTLAASRAIASRVRHIASAYRTEVEYPSGEFSSSLRVVAALLDAGFGARVYSVMHSGYDSHSLGCGDTTERLGGLSRALHAFFTDLARSSAAQDVLMLGYSEFGRRVAENSSHGTDHGAAGPMWLLGAGLRPGLHGAPADLENLDEHGNLRHRIDYRSVYGAVLDGWLKVPHERVLGRRFESPGQLLT